MVKETPLDTVETDTTCSYCSVGCSLKLESYGDMLIKANPDKNGTVNAGLACAKGKWGFDCSMLENKLEEPLIKYNGEFREADYHEALVMIAKKCQAVGTKYGKDSVAVSISDRYTNEEAYAIKKMAEAMDAKVLCMNNRKSGIADVIGHDASPNTIDEMLSTDLILAVGFNGADNPVIQLKMRQAAAAGAKVVLINPEGYEQNMNYLAKEVYTANDLSFIKALAKAVADSGKGGNIVLRVNDNLSTLMDFRYKRKYAAAPGQDGQGARCSGKRGEDLVIQVPRGTVVRDAATNEIIKDMSDDADFILCKGGRGGWGNKHFATPTRQVPRFAKAGLPGEEHEVVLELKLLADVGLVGFPNVGKSTLLSVTSNARPKIANYHFTTLYPNLGVIYVDEGVSFVMADIPGIIEGAAEGAGLGHDFLRHIDRCRLLVHIVDVSGSEDRDPIEDFEKINAELRDYSPELAERPMIVAANKCDLIPEGSDNLERLRVYVTERGYPFYEISAATTQGTKQLMRVIAGRLRELPPVTVYEPEYVKPLAEAGEADALSIEHMDDLWVVSGKWMQQLIADINFADYESRMYFDRQLRKSGLFDRLEEMGIEDGDTVSIYDFEFEYER